MRILNRWLVVSVLGLATSTGCATSVATRASDRVVAARVEQQKQQPTHRFRAWLARDCGWTQRQRLAHIERDWLGYLLMLSDQDRYEAAVAIQSAINSPTLDEDRERLIEQVLGASQPLASR